MHRAYLVEASSQEQPWQAPEPFWDWPDARRRRTRAPEEANAETGSTSSDWLGSEPTVQESDIVETIDTEFLIVGAGTAQPVAACAAGEGHRDVRSGEVQRRHHARRRRRLVNSRLQQESGYTMDLQEYLLDMNHYAAGQCNLNLHKTWYEKSGEAIDWYRPCSTSYGVKLWHEAAEEKHRRTTSTGQPVIRPPGRKMARLTDSPCCPITPRRPAM